MNMGPLGLLGDVFYPDVNSGSMDLNCSGPFNRYFVRLDEFKAISAFVFLEPFLSIFQLCARVHFLLSLQGTCFELGRCWWRVGSGCLICNNVLGSSTYQSNICLDARAQGL